MQLGFVSAILGDLQLEEVLQFAADEGFDCVELMCWPPGKSDRRYAGVTHLDVTDFSDELAAHVTARVRERGLTISGLGYYPNPLDADPAHRHAVATHLAKVISAAAKLHVRIVNTFIGRDPSKSLEDNWPVFRSVWPEIVQHAAAKGVQLAIENCPMLFGPDQWPGGKNLAVSPAVWRRIFTELDPITPTQAGKNTRAEREACRVGLNFDPSHLIWQHIDCVRCVREFAGRILHVHAKDTRIDGDSLFEAGILGAGWHTPKLPGLGDVNWGALFSALTDAGFDGAICIEVEDRAFERSLGDRKRALRQSKRFLEQFVA